MNYILLLFLAILPVNITAMDFIRGLFSHSRVTAQKNAVKIKNENKKNLEAYRAKWKHLIEKKPEAPLLLYTFLSTTKCSKDFTPKKEENKKYRDMQREKFAQGQDAKKLNDFDAVVVSSPENVTQNSLSYNVETKQFILKNPQPLTRTEYKTAGFVDSIKKYFWPEWWSQQQIKSDNKFWYRKYALENQISILNQQIKIYEKNMTPEEKDISSNSENSYKLNNLNKKLNSIKILYNDLIIIKTPSDEKDHQKNIYLHQGNPDSFFNDWLNRESSKKGKLISNNADKIFYTNVFFDR